MIVYQNLSFYHFYVRFTTVDTDLQSVSQIQHHS